MGWADTPREVAEQCDVVFTMLTNTAAIEGAAHGDDGLLAGLGAGKVWADLSTIAPERSVALSEEVAATGARYLDTPVSGSPATLAAGQMSVMVGGERSAYDHVEALLHAIGPKVTYIGPNGHAILTKVAINLSLVVSVTAFAEAVTLVEKAGVDRAAVVDAALKSVIASPVIGYRAPLLVDDDTVFADVELQQKDLVLAQELGRKLGRDAADLLGRQRDAQRRPQQRRSPTVTSSSASPTSTAEPQEWRPDDDPREASRRSAPPSTTSRSSRACARRRAGSTCRCSTSSTPSAAAPTASPSAAPCCRPAPVTTATSTPTPTSSSW